MLLESNTEVEKLDFCVSIRKLVVRERIWETFDDDGLVDETMQNYHSPQQFTSVSRNIPCLSYLIDLTKK